MGDGRARRSREAMSNIIWLDPFPEFVWERLPGGPSAWNPQWDEAQQYLGSTIPEVPGCLRHEFRHRAHPLYWGFRVYAHVLDDDTGPRLDRLICFVDNDEELFLPSSDIDW